jgi:hypothetical protein
MTLNITIVAPWGIWQCSDHRLTNPNTGRPVQDDSIKHVAFRFPDGGALLAYSGIGSVADLNLSDWVREILRGESRNLDDSLIYLREQATSSIGPIVQGKYHHMFSIGAFLQGRAWIIQIRNFESKTPGVIGPPLGEFITVALEIKDSPMVFVSGERRSLNQRDYEELAKIALNYPRKANDFHSLLAKYNKKASQHSIYGKAISSGCMTSFMPPKAEPIDSKLHNGGTNQPRNLTIPILVFGIDLTETSSLLSQRLDAMSSKDEAAENSKIDQLFEEAAKRSVKPMNRLSRYTKKRSDEE